MDANSFIAVIPMPFTGESIVDGVVVSWLVSAGETVEKGRHIAEIETEKSVWEFESPCSGRIIEFCAEVGDVVDVEAPLLKIETDDENMRHLQETDEAGAKETESGTAEDFDEGVAVEEKKQGRRRRLLSPRVKRILKENELTEEVLEKIEPTGPAGSITAKDVERFLQESGGITGYHVPQVKKCYIAGIGTYVPEKIVKNKRFMDNFADIDESYITKVTGIEERRWAANELTSDIAYHAAQDALASSPVSADEIDLIILATTTADMPLPSTACALVDKLGCADIPAFDMQAACSGWLYGLSIGQQFIQNGTYKNILVVAAEIMSRFTDVTDRATAFLFGDGAGAAVLSSEKRGHILSDVVLKTDSSGYDIIYRKAGGSRMPYREMKDERDDYWYMDGGRMFRSAVTNFAHIIEKVAEKTKTALHDFAWFVPHQANQRILKSVAKKVDALPEKFFSNIKHYGNTSAASIPIALKDLEKGQKVTSGDKLLLCAVGAGLTSAGCVITWK